MNPSWYDVLGVEHDAGPEEIRAAWKASIADLDPTDRRFRQRNRAAEVLLDPARRAAHDAELAEEPGEPDEPDEPEPAVVSLDKRAPVADEPAEDPADAAPPASEPGRARVLLAAGLGLVALVLVVVTVVSLVGDDDPEGAAASDPNGAPASESAGDLPDAREIQAARTAAETAVGPVLSYDYRTLEASEAAALSYMTPGYAEEYRKIYDGTIVPNAERTQTVVTVDLVASGVVRTGVDRVDVLLFVNRPTSNAERQRTYRDQVTARMLAVDGAWLVDCLITQPGDVCAT